MKSCAKLEFYTRMFRKQDITDNIIPICLIAMSYHGKKSVTTTAEKHMRQQQLSHLWVSFRQLKANQPLVMSSTLVRNENNTQLNQSTNNSINYD